MPVLSFLQTNLYYLARTRKTLDHANCYSVMDGPLEVSVALVFEEKLSKERCMCDDHDDEQC